MKAQSTIVLTNKSKLIIASLLSIFFIGVIGYGVSINKTEHKPQQIVRGQAQPREFVQGQVAGVAMTTELSPTPTVRLYKPRVGISPTSIPTQQTTNSNQPQSNNNSSGGSSNNSQSLNTTTSQTTIVTQPTVTPTQQSPTLQEPTNSPSTQASGVQLEIVNINSTEGTITANKPLKECYVTGGEYTGTNNTVVIAHGKRNVDGNTCLLQNKAPDFVNVTGKVIDFDGQEKTF